MVELLTDHGLLIRANTATESRAQADDWLGAHGVDDLDDPRPQRAWWDNGFVQEHHDGAEAVFVVNLPLPVLARIA